MSASLTRDGAKLQVSGHIGFAGANTACDQGLALIAAAPGDVVVDLAGLESPSSVSVAVLLRWARAVAARGNCLSLANVPEKCRAILSVSGLAEALPEVSV
ncbi:MAG: STAS domain-containing protein [Moraxellaceae bacterium]